MSMISPPSSPTGVIELDATSPNFMSSNSKRNKILFGVKVRKLAPKRTTQHTTSTNSASATHTSKQHGGNKERGRGSKGLEKGRRDANENLQNIRQLLSWSSRRWSQNEQRVTIQRIQKKIEEQEQKITVWEKLMDHATDSIAARSKNKNESTIRIFSKLLRQYQSEFNKAVFARKDLCDILEDVTLSDTYIDIDKMIEGTHLPSDASSKREEEEDGVGRKRINAKSTYVVRVTKQSEPKVIEREPSFRDKDLRSKPTSSMRSSKKSRMSSSRKVCVDAIRDAIKCEKELEADGEIDQTKTQPQQSIEPPGDLLLHRSRMTSPATSFPDRRKSNRKSHLIRRDYSGLMVPLSP